MTPETEKKAEHDGNIVDSTVEMGFAAAKFAMDQLETALCAVNSPGKAIDRMKRSMDQFTDAMNASVEPGSKEKGEKTQHSGSRVETPRKAESEPREVEEEGAAEEAAFTGRKT